MESSENENAAMAGDSTNQSVVPSSQQGQIIENLATENMEQSTLTNELTKCANETSEESKPSDGKDGEQQKDGDVSQTENKHATKEAMEGKTQANDGQSSMESPRLQKKTKKTKKKEQQQQQPVSEQAIPLPPPSTESAK